jgi:hypothetical protein
MTKADIIKKYSKDLSWNPLDYPPAHLQETSFGYVYGRVAEIPEDTDIRAELNKHFNSSNDCALATILAMVYVGETYDLYARSRPSSYTGQRRLFKAYDIVGQRPEAPADTAIFAFFNESGWHEQSDGGGSYRCVIGQDDDDLDKLW